MERDEATMTRRSLLVGGAGLFALGGIPGAFAKLPAGGFKGLIGNASDGALDKLSEPGAFYADTAVRILLPGANGKLASKLFGVGDRLGLTTSLTKSLNDATAWITIPSRPGIRVVRSSGPADIVASVAAPAP